jgi:hypothetical protein
MQGSTLTTEKNNGSIIWNGRLGYINLSAGISMIAVDPTTENTFSIMADEP